VQWLVEHDPNRVCYEDQDKAHAPTSAILSGRRFAAHYGIEGGVSAAHMRLDDTGEHTEEPIFFVDSNQVVPGDRYSEEEWLPLAQALRFTGKQRWYLELIC
jgi:hypothetical protein